MRVGKTMDWVKNTKLEKMACRYCKFAERGYISRAYCSQYPFNIWKPADIFLGDTPCPRFEKGEDLLPFEKKPEYFI
jgi:hypothetical protein